MNTFKTIFLLASLVFTLSACSEDEPAVYEYEEIRFELLQNSVWCIPEKIAGIKEMDFYFGDEYSDRIQVRYMDDVDNPLIENGEFYSYGIIDGVMYFGYSNKSVEIRMIKGTLTYTTSGDTDFWRCKIEIRGFEKTYVVPIYQTALFIETK